MKNVGEKKHDRDVRRVGDGARSSNRVRVGVASADDMDLSPLRYTAEPVLYYILCMRRRCAGIKHLSGNMVHRMTGKWTLREKRMRKQVTCRKQKQK
jgi:hypothetical protein